MNQFQLGAGVVRDNQTGDHFVQWNIAHPPLTAGLILAPDVMQQVLDWANANLPGVIEEARRANTMKGFQVVGEMPTLPAVFDAGNGGRRG